MSTIATPAATPRTVGRGLAVPGALLTVAAATPLVSQNSYMIGVMVLICIYAVVAQAWNLVMGVAGIWWFATMATFAVGAYANVLLMTQLAVPAPIAFLGGGAAAGLVSLAIGIPAVRLRGVYVVLFTLALHQVLQILLINDSSGLTNGTFGLYGFDALGLGNKDALASVTITYYIALAFLVACTAVMWVVTRSSLGIAARALRDAEPYAVSRGIGRSRHQIAIFVIASVMTGLAGALYADHLDAISPTVLNFDQFTMLLAMVVIGGWATFWGPILGAVVVLIVSEQLRAFDEWRLLILAVLMILVIVAMPRGLIGLAQPLAGLGKRLRRRLDGWLEA